MTSSIDFLSIPLDSDRDVHICGRCKIMYHNLTEFMDHKLTECGDVKENESKEDKQWLCRYDSLREISDEKQKNMDRRDPLVGNYANHVLTESTGCVIRSVKTSNYCSGPDHDNVKLSRQEKSVEPGASPNVEVGSYRCSKKEKFKCPVDSCDYSSFLMKDIKRHVRTHTGERPFKCMLCPKMFTRKDKFKVHLRIHKGDKKYKCPDCDYAAVESNTLLRHTRIHSGHKPFKCQLCSYSARDKSQLTVHLRMHTGDSPYVCAYEKCKAAFKTSTGLKRHASVHSPKTPNPCPYCSFKANSKAELLSHVLKKHPNEDDVQFKIHDCPHCVDRFFSSKAKFKAHLKTKHPLLMIKDSKPPVKQKKRRLKGVDMKREYECQQCEASFVCPGSLRTHERQHDKKNNPVYQPPKPQATTDAPVFLGYVENTQLDVNLKTAEMLASLADDTRTVNTASLYYSSDDEGIKLIEANFI